MKLQRAGCGIYLRGLPVCTTSNIEILGQGETHRVKMKSKASSQDYRHSSCWMANFLWDTWTCHSLSNIDVCTKASGNLRKHQPNGKRLEKSTLAASTLACSVFICTNPEQIQNTRPIRQFTMAGTLQVVKLWHAGFSYVQTSSKTVFKPQVYGAGPCHQVQPDLKESSINFFFALGNCRFPPLPRIEVWLGFVHMKKTTDRRCAHGMAFSNRMRGHRDVFKVCLEFVHMKTQHIEGCHQESAHPSMKWAACRHQQGLFEVCTYENTAEGRGTKRCKQTDG